MAPTPQNHEGRLTKKERKKKAAKEELLGGLRKAEKLLSGTSLAQSSSSKRKQKAERKKRERELAAAKEEKRMLEREAAAVGEELGEMVVDDRDGEGEMALEDYARGGMAALVEMDERTATEKMGEDGVVGSSDEAHSSHYSVPGSLIQLTVKKISLRF
ncbi:hypothetical protein N431DRAFT_462975 [Stipitochalara longipes BDJ]|nr:hypothetical protein N431DRAFT_462975 [Stipitochalara longipes BDJ]